MTYAAAGEGGGDGERDAGLLRDLQRREPGVRRCSDWGQLWLTAAQARGDLADVCGGGGDGDGLP